MVVNDSAKKYNCICGKNFMYDSGYYRHKKKCTKVANSEITAEIIKNNLTEEMFFKLLEQNNELLKKMSEISI